MWKEIQGYEGLYEVSDTGIVRSLDRIRCGRVGGYIKGQEIKPRDNIANYLVVDLCKEGNKRIHRVHRLVANAFIPNPLNKPEVNHKDGDRHNNNVENLEWCTHQENIQHAFSTGLYKGKGTSKLTQEECDYIREAYKKYDRDFGCGGLARRFGVDASIIWHVVNDGLNSKVV